MTADHGQRLRRYSPKDPILLLTDYPPDTLGGGAVILRDLLGTSEREKVLWISPAPSSSDVDHSVTLRSGSWGRSGKRSIGIDTTLRAGALAEEVEQVAAERGAKAIWIVMHGAAVAIAERLSRRTRLPVHLTVHDDPAFANALRSKRYLPLVPWIERDFGRTLARARSIDVIGESMRERYRKRYGVDSGRRPSRGRRPDRAIAGL